MNLFFSKEVVLKLNCYFGRPLTNQSNVEFKSDFAYFVSVIVSLFAPQLLPNVSLDFH